MLRIKGGLKVNIFLIGTRGILNSRQEFFQVNGTVPLGAKLDIVYW